MKRCPTCRRDFFDDTLSFCLEDGAALVYGVATEQLADEDASTAILPHFKADPRRTNEQFPAAPTERVDVTNAVAVLPFVNIGRGEDIEYFSDGLAEELLNVLSKIHGLRVAARTSAFSFKG